MNGAGSKEGYISCIRSQDRHLWPLGGKNAGSGAQSKDTQQSQGQFRSTNGSGIHGCGRVEFAIKEPDSYKVLFVNFSCLQPDGGKATKKKKVK